MKKYIIFSLVVLSSALRATTPDAIKQGLTGTQPQQQTPITQSGGQPVHPISGARMMATIMPPSVMSQTPNQGTVNNRADE